MHRFGIEIIITLAVMTSACTSTDSTSSGASLANVKVEETTTTTSPPLLIATIPNLDLPIGECWNELAHTTSTTQPAGLITTTASSTTAPQPTLNITTIPRPDVVARVHCAGTNQGRVYASFCIGAESETDLETAVGAQTADALIKVPCPGGPNQIWPGDRELRRAAARYCLDTFVEHFGEIYALSERVARELTPNEGVWNRGERRVVCSATEPPPIEITTSTSTN